MAPRLYFMTFIMATNQWGSKGRPRAPGGTFFGAALC